MAQDVGPILEMVTEKYLLRSETEWRGRQEAIGILDEVMEHLKKAISAAIGACTERNFDGPIQTIIPWAGNLYTDTLIRRTRASMGQDFWGFWMLGGMSGGGMGFLCSPERKPFAQERLGAIMSATKRAWSTPSRSPWSRWSTISPSTSAEPRRAFFAAMTRCMPADYYTLAVPPLLRTDSRLLSPGRRAELDRFTAACRTWRNSPAW
jgi:hypothetical protein